MSRETPAFIYYPGIIALILISLSILGCLQGAFSDRRQFNVMSPVYMVDDFPKEIARLEKIAREDPTPKVRAMAHFQLAALWAHHRNPDVDYSRALDELDMYMRLDPEASSDDQNLNWLAMLGEMDFLRRENKALEEKISMLGRENNSLQAQIENLKILQSGLDRMQGKIDSLTEENRKMQEALEKLKSLDLWLEEQRGRIK